jgi:opacity protein-like surface antigen
MKNQIKKYIAVSVLVTAATIRVANAASIPSPLEDCSRKGRAEIYAIAESLSGWERTKLNNGNISLKIDSGIGGGVGFGYNINEYLNVNTAVTGSGVNFKAQDSDFGEVSGDTSIVKWDVNLDYNILKKRLTPLLTAGVGMTYFSGSFDGNSFLEFGEADLVWGIGGGVRWDISDHWFAKATYRVNWADLQESDSPTRFNSIALGIGYTF